MVLVSVRGSSENVMSVIGVYLPCLDLGIDCYREHLVELECVVSECEMLDSVVILGDCNAHLSVDGREFCYRKSWTGITLQMSPCMGCLAIGPSYTYCSGSVCTKIDYALMNVGAASLLSSVETRSMVDLNVSNHLPIVIK